MNKILLLCSCILVCDARVNLEEEDIQKIYDDFIKPSLTAEYANRYTVLPLAENANPNWKWEKRDLPRVIAVLEFKRIVGQRQLKCRKGLGINGRDPEWDYILTNNLTCISYPDNKKDYDLQRLRLKYKEFDFVMVNQTLEHVYSPLDCLKNIYDHMSVGGILYFNVPANSIPHETPFHFYTGYTPVGVGALVMAAGFKILEIGWWGNIEYLRRMFAKGDWPDYREARDCTYNDFRCPIVTWIFAVKN